MIHKLKYVSDIFLDDYETNFEEKYLPLYLNEDRDAITKLFSDSENVIDSNIDFDYKDLILESEDPKANLKNIRIIWDSLKHLSISQASNRKLWIALENTYYLDYHLDCLRDSRITGIISRTTFKKNGNKRSLVINNLASLWWIAYYTIDKKASNMFYYAERFMAGSYRGNAVAFFSSNITSNKEIVLGTLEAIYELVDENRIKETRESYTEANKLLNMMGGVICLDALRRDEIKDIVKEKLLEMPGVKVFTR